MPPSDELIALIRQEIELYGDEFALAKSGWRIADGQGSTFARPAKNRPAAAAGSAADLPPLPIEAINSLDELSRVLCECRQCSMSRNRQQVIFGAGNPKADIVLVGDWPLREDDQAGEPFRGEAGLLLDKILASISLERSQVYLCTILKCHPADHHDPQAKEIEICLTYLRKQLALIAPKFILCLGHAAAVWLLRKKEPLSQLRGQTHNYLGARVIVTYAPATLLRYPQYKRDTWQDMLLLRRLYDQSSSQPVL